MRILSSVFSVLFLCSACSPTFNESTLTDPSSLPDGLPVNSETTPEVDEPAQSVPPETDYRPYAMAKVTDLQTWLASPLPRGEVTSVGDRSIGIRRTSNKLPLKVSSQYQTTICSGAGCPLKIPFNFTMDHINRIKLEMKAALEKAKCLSDTPACERVALARAVVVMEMIVHDEYLLNMTTDQQRASSGSGSYESGKQLTQDCVDQATNGITYLWILAQENLIRHHQIVHPGQITILIIQPHFFTQIMDRSGQVYRFDLYHRGRFGIPPYVALAQ